MRSDQGKKCSCYDNGVCLDNRHLSWVVAFALLLGFSFFVAGFFLGKHRALHDLRITLDQDSLADKIYTSLCTTQEDKMMMAQQEDDDVELVESSESDYRQLADAEVAIMSSESSLPEPDSPEGIAREASSSADKNEVLESSTRYFAQLVGFGTRQAAQKFVQRLQQVDIPVEVKDRHSKTAKGKKVTWYQVVTTSFSDKGELEKLVNEIKVKERLKDVRIITC